MIVPNSLMFVRIKKRGESGNYAYLVENFWTNGSSRQRIKNYLGKVYDLKPIHEIQVIPNLDLNYNDLILDMIKNELLRHGFNEKEGVYFLDKVFVNLNIGTIYDSKGRNVVIKINDGHLCDYYLQGLLGLRVSDEKVKGIQLANFLVSAGLKVRPESFVELYKKLPGPEKELIVDEPPLTKNEELDEFGLSKNRI